jgi:hypothetical protein
MWVCGRPIAEIVGSNYGGEHGFLSLVGVVCLRLRDTSSRNTLPPEIRVCCQIKSLRRIDHSSRGVLPNVACLSVIAKPL